MVQIVTTLVLFSTALIISSCSGKVIYVPKQCEIPKVDEIVIDYKDRNTTLGEAKRCVSNYTKYKEAYEKLEASIKVCQ